jgi:hypothetical protein
LPLAYDIHPEFGYLWPGPRVRRELRVAAVSMLLGVAIGAAIVSIRASQAVETDGVSSNSHLKSSGPDTLLPGVAGRSFQFKSADNGNADPVQAVKPYPMRTVRVRPKKSASPIAGIPLGDAAPPEPGISPASTGSASPDNAQSFVASPQAQSFAATAEPAVTRTKKQPRIMHARRQRDDEDERRYQDYGNARWQNRRTFYWGDRGYAYNQDWRGAYRNWVYR